MAKVVEVVKSGTQPGRVMSVHWLCSECLRKIPRDSVWCAYCGVRLSG